MTYEEAFKKIKESLKNADTSKLTGDFAVQIDLTNKDCSGAFYISYFDGVFSVEPYDYVDNYARLAIMYGDFNKLVTGKLDVNKAIESEKIYVTGDVSVVEGLGTLISAPAPKEKKKPAAPKEKKEKKTAAKKAPAAKKSETAAPADTKSAAVKKETEKADKKPKKENKTIRYTILYYG